MESLQDKTLYPLSTTQNSLKWAEVFSLEREKTKEINIISFYVRVPKNANPDLLEKAFYHLISTNDALRLHLVGKGLSQKQYIADVKEVPLERMNVRNEQELIELSKHLYRYKINWTDEKLYWAILVEVGKGKGDWALVMRFHHAIVDGYSIALICKRLEKAYNALVAGEEIPEEKTCPFPKFLEMHNKYLHSAQCKNDRKFWWRTFLTQPHYSLPAGRRAAFADCLTDSFKLDGKTYRKIQEMAHDEGLTLQGCLLNLVALTTYVVKNKTNFSICSLTHGRTTLPLRNTIGCMMNTVPIFFNIDIHKPIRTLMGEWYSNYLEYISHGRLPMSEMTFMFYKEAVLHGFNFNHAWMSFSSMEYGSVLAHSNMQVGIPDDYNMPQQFYLYVLDVPNEYVELRLTYQKRRFTPERIHELFRQYQAVCKAVMDNPNMTPQDLRAQMIAQNGGKK